jgi:tRNA A37 threonylcarbamoyladenosine synthetase subunit TsaC/SUA5/YrdC
MQSLKMIRNNINRAIETLNNSEIVAIADETVYGLAVN